ncbi:putative major facilitator superfamily, MFS transporter superfamily [Septoria linicola]|nr:putative major facilitator superfamily, MFS transporter superfamily [Septoria linicola]
MSQDIPISATIVDPVDIEEWPLRPDSPIDIGIINFDRRTPDSQAATLAGHHRSSTPVTINFDRHTPDSIAAAKRSRRSSITNSGDFSIGNFSFEQFPFQGELKEKLEQHVRRDGAEHASLFEEGEEEGDDGYDASIYPETTSLVLIMIALCLAVFCMCLDMTIISTAIPRITDDFKAIDDVGWYASSYMLTLSAFQLFFGKLYSLSSTKWVFMIALFWFEVGSAICGAAPTSVALIVGRAVAGFGSAGLFSGALLIIAASAPLRKRPTYIGIVGSMYGIASVTGPLMGGAFTDKLSWRWCFYINLPIGAVTMLFIIFFYREQPRAGVLSEGWKARLSQFDVEGLIIFLPTVVCLLLALQWGGTQYEWSSGRIIALLVLFGCMLLVFIALQFWKKDKATVPLRVLRQRSIAASAWLAFTLGASFFVFTYYIPIWFQAIQSASPVQSGIRNIPMVLSVVISSVPTGVAVTYVGYYTPFAILSSILLAIGAGLTTTWTTDTSSSQWIGYQVLLGLGVGFGFQQTMLAAQTCLPKQDVPIGTAIVVFFQTLGGAIIVSVANNIFNSQLLSGIVRVVPELDPSTVLETGATSLKDVIPNNLLPAVLRVYNDALVGTFYVGTGLAALSIIGSCSLEWKSVKGAEVHMVAV